MGSPATADALSSSWHPPLSEPNVKKKRTRRGKRNSEKYCINNTSSINSDWKIFHSNIRGFNSKKVSLKNIISRQSPNVITLNEVGLKGNKKFTIQGYSTFGRNLQKLNIGGIATTIISNESQFCLKVDEGENEDEFIVTRHGQFQKPINIINVYGEQECRKQEL